MKKALISAILCLHLSGCASYKIGPADVGQLVDSTTTAIAVYGPTGAMETNGLINGAVGSPLGMVGVALTKEALVYVGKNLDQSVCRPLSGLLFGLGFGPGINNILVMSGISGVTGFGLAFSLGLISWGVYDFLHLYDYDCKPQEPKTQKIPYKNPESTRTTENLFIQ